MNVKLNGTELSDPSTNWYPYKAYLESLLSYSRSTKEGRLKANCFYKDVAGQFEHFPTIASGQVQAVETNNTGYKKRKNLFKTSGWMYFCINLHTDLTTLRKYIPPNVGIDINLQRMEDKFSILSGSAGNDTLSIILDDIILKVRRYTPAPRITSYHNNTLARQGSCFLPIDRSLIKKYTVPTGLTDASAFNFIHGAVLPDQMIIGMVEESAYAGDYKKNPFNFQHFNPSEISLVVNGKSSFLLIVHLIKIYSFRYARA